jgi:predicted nucleic-acid-binding Zn-ribbon protein
MSLTKTCPKCDRIMKSDNLMALVSVFKESRGYNVKTDIFIPVRPYLCKKCGYIELYHDTG